MLYEHADIVSRLTHVLTPIFLAWLSSRIICKQIQLREDNQKTKIYKEKVNDVGDLVDKMLIGFILPSYFAIALLKADLEINDLAILLLGFLFPTCVMILNILWEILSKDAKSNPPWYPFLFASFGGGNRGTLLITLLIPAVLTFSSWHVSAPDVIATFALFDLGNFIFLILCMRALMVRFSNNQETLEENSSSLNFSEAMSKLINTSSVVIFVSCVASILNSAGVFEIIKHENYFKYLNSSFDIFIPKLSFLFAYFAFLSIFLRFKVTSRGITLERAFAIFIKNFITRAIVAISLLFIAYLFYSIPSFAGEGQSVNPIFYALGLIVIVFVFLPPSSLFSSLANDTFSPKQKDGKVKYSSVNNELNELILASNFLFVVLMALVFTLSELFILIKSQM